MVSDPQHVLRDSNDNDVAYFWYDAANDNVVIEHASSGEQIRLDTNGLADANGDAFAIDGDAQPPEEHDNAAHSEGFVSDGDGTTRQVWVIANGASDPAGADPEDIIFEEES